MYNNRPCLICNSLIYNVKVKKYHTNCSVLRTPTILLLFHYNVSDTFYYILSLFIVFTARSPYIFTHKITSIYFFSIKIVSPTKHGSFDLTVAGTLETLYANVLDCVGAYILFEVYFIAFIYSGACKPSDGL